MHIYLRIVVIACLLICSQALGAELDTLSSENTSEGSSEFAWNIVLVLIVLATTLGSAVLPLSALRHWIGGWRIAAVCPLFLLLAWIALIIISKLGNQESHTLWQFEIFAWAMLNMIYMVSLITIKRVLEKEDEKKSISS